MVDQGLSADKVETAAYGKDRPMPQDDVVNLDGMNPQMPPAKRFKTRTAMGLFAQFDETLGVEKRISVAFKAS